MPCSWVLSTFCPNHRNAFPRNVLGRHKLISLWGWLNFLPKNRIPYCSLSGPSVYPKANHRLEKGRGPILVSPCFLDVSPHLWASTAIRVPYYPQPLKVFRHRRSLLLLNHSHADDLRGDDEFTEHNPRRRPKSRRIPRQCSLLPPHPHHGTPQLKPQSRAT